MGKQNNVGVYQLDNGNWAFRFAVMANGKQIARKKVKDEFGNCLKTKKDAIKARQLLLTRVQQGCQETGIKEKKTVLEIYNEYCESGRNGKAYATIKKQDSLWNNHIKTIYGKRYIDEISVAEINDYLSKLYYYDNRAYSYTESFLKMFYLIFGQAYSRNYLDTEIYNKFCKNKDTKIHMPKRKIDEDDEIVSFSEEEMCKLDKYFKGTNIETAYMIGKYCGLRINECFGLKWDNIDIQNGKIYIDRQMQYQDGLIKLVPLKTRNAKRTIYMAKLLKQYLTEYRKKDNELSASMREQRQQNQTIIKDIDGKEISSLNLLNTLPNGKIQTVNSIKYHTRMIKEQYAISFKYHYLRHHYATYLATLNTPIHILCGQMGHSSSNVTQRYYTALSEKGIEVLLENLNQLI